MVWDFFWFCSVFGCFVGFLLSENSEELMEELHCRKTGNVETN